jgi:polysaccharide export outer membrane protein
MNSIRVRRSKGKLLMALVFCGGVGVAAAIQAAQWVQDGDALEVDYSTADPASLPPASASGSAQALAAEAAVGDQEAAAAATTSKPLGLSKTPPAAELSRATKPRLPVATKSSPGPAEAATPIPQRALAGGGAKPNAVNASSLADAMDSSDMAGESAAGDAPMNAADAAAAERAMQAAAEVGADAPMSSGAREPVAYVAPGPQYLVQPGDILQITVWKEEDLQREVLVRPDGGMSFPLAGDVVAAGRTVEQIQKDLSSRIESFIPEPVVTVAVKQVVGNRVYVVGRVNKPGEIIMGHELTVMQALSLAGGVTPFAALNKVHVLRRDNGVERSIPFRYGDVEKGRNLSQNIILQNGDVVVVP